MDNVKYAIGLMTGTVLDGFIDVALIRSDGVTVQDFGPCSMEPYAQDTVDLLHETLQVAQSWQFEGPEPAIFAEAEHRITVEQSNAVGNVVLRHKLELSDIGVIGFHGQSVLHRAPTASQVGQTRQLGDGQLMARALGVPVVWDFRSADMAAGGQGAPLAPVYHRALLQHAVAEGRLHRQCAVLNLGGVANITWWGEDDSLIAFDTGPANAPINDWIARHTAETMDIDGRYAAAGQLDKTRLKQLLQHPYLDAPYPKSLDRFDFAAAMADGSDLEDGARLLTAFSAAAVGKALSLLPSRPQCLVLCGGGRHNPALVSEIETQARVSVIDADDIGWRGDAIEAECFAFLAERVVRGFALEFPDNNRGKRGVQGWPTK